MLLQARIAVPTTTVSCIVRGMNTTGKRIAIAREEKGWNQSELGRALKVSPQSVQAWESGKNTPRPKKMAEIAAVLGRSIGYLMGDIDASELSNVEPGPPITSPYRAIKIVGTAQMGTEGYWYSLDDGEGYVDIPSSDPNAYALRLRGDSMEPAIHSGWLAVIEPGRSFVPGEYVMVQTVEGESMLKRLLYANDDQVSLLSVNVAHSIRNIPIEQIQHIHAVGAIVPPSKVRV